MIKSQKYKEWQTNREIFRWITTAAIFLYGLESQGFLVTVLFYLMERYDLSKDDVSFYLSLTQFLSCSVEMVSGLGLGRYADQTRNLRKVVLLNLAATFVLNLIYTLPVPLWVIIIARTLTGVSESLQTAVVGEFRRIYIDDKSKLVSVLSWYEIALQTGRNFGAILLLILSSVSFKVGNWKIDKLNILNFLLSISGLLLLIISLFKIKDVSKDFDRLKLTNDDVNHTVVSGEQTQGKSDLNEINKTSTPAVNDDQPSLMKWHEVFTFDIITIILSISLIRYENVVFISNTVILTATKYGWKSNYLFALFFVCNSFVIIITSALTKTGFFKGRFRPFFMQTIAITTAVLILISINLTKVDILRTFGQQVVFFSILKLTKAFTLFVGNTCGLLLLFRLVKPQDSSFVAGYKSFIMVMFKAYGFLTAYKAAFYPEYFQTPFVVVMLVLVHIMLRRREIHLYRTKTTN
ncbi:uncharacterized protein [Clytia hemisphaerica]